MFAGSTVVVSIFGLVLMGRDYLWGVALATSLAVTMVVLASVTLLPALLGFAGRTIDRFRLPWFRHDVDGRRTLSWRWSRIMQRRPLLAGLAALVVLLALAAPALDMRFGMPDAGNGPEELTSRQAYDLMSEGFGPGANGPFLVAVDLAGAPDDAAATDTVDGLAADLAATDGVDTVLPPVLNDQRRRRGRDGRAHDGAAGRGDRGPGPHLRDDVIPAAVSGTGVDASVGGTTAAFIDDSEQTASRLPLFIGGRGPALVHPAHVGVPVAARGRQGGVHEHPVDRRRLRRHDAGGQRRLARRAGRHRRTRPRSRGGCR